MISFLNLKGINQQYADELKEAAAKVIDSGWYLQGSANAAFEQHYADYIGTQFCVGVANGLDALTLIYRAYIETGVMQPGDEVIVPANTYIASILAISENGLKPVLVEPCEDTLELDDSLIETAITSRTRSIMVVHLYGRCAYTERIGELCRQYGLKLVEDNAQAHGCIYNKGTRTGSLGDAAGHSFYPGKNLGALGDGGAVTTNNQALADCIRALANYGSQQKYVFRYRGRNSRLDELQAALLDVKLRHLDNDNRRRQQIARFYYDNIQHPQVHLPHRLDDSQNVYHIFPVLCTERDHLQQHLRQQGIETLIHYPIPPHRQQCYSEWKELKLPVTERIHNQELSLPISPVLTDDEARQVVEAVNTF
jgi:dTDP-4-amino-4,6-dideoxygalactose transaminase